MALAIAGGINALAHLTQSAVRYAQSRGLAVEWREAFCSLL